MAFTITPFTGNYGLASADRGNLRKATDTVAQTITLDTTLGAGWACNIENANTGITKANNSLVLKPSSGTIDGASTFTAYRGDVRGVACDGTNWLSICIRTGDSVFDGTSPLVKNLNAANQVVTAVQWAQNTSDVTWAFPGNGTLLSYLAPGSQTLTVQASTRYMFEAQYQTTHGAVSKAINFGFGGTATFTDCTYVSTTASGTAQGVVADGVKWCIVATSTAIMNASTSTASIGFLKGSFAINGAGVIVPSIAMTADPTGTILMTTGCSFRCWAIGNNTVAAVGAWS